MMETPQRILNPSVNLPPTISQKVPQKLSDVISTPPTRIFSPPPKPVVNLPTPPKLPQMNAKVTYVVKTCSKIIGPHNGMISSHSPSFAICKFRGIRPVGSMVQNPFHPGMYIRSPNKVNPSHLNNNGPTRMQGIIRVIQPTTKYPVMVAAPKPQPPLPVQTVKAPTPKKLAPFPPPPPPPPPPPMPKKIVVSPKEYPCEAKIVFEASVERPARLAPINWKQFREDYKHAKGGEAKVLKPWDIYYQPLTTKQRAAKTILNIEKFPQATSISLNSQIGPAGPLTEKNISIDGKKKKLLSVSSSSSERVTIKRKHEEKEPRKKKFKKFRIMKETVKQEIIEPKIFPPRLISEEIVLTIGKIDYAAEEHVYNHIAFNRLLHDGYLNFLADMRLSTDPEDLSEMLALIKIANARNFKTAAYLDGKTKRPKVMPVISKYLPVPDLPTEEENRIDSTKTGCARVCEAPKKTLLSPIKRRVGKRFTVVTKEDEENMKRAQERGKHERHLTRQMLTQLQIEQPELAKLDIFKTNNAAAFHKFLKHAKSPIHGDGLFALAPIEPDQLIIEYTGEKIRHELANIRERKYEKQGIFSSYMFRLDDMWVVDATKMGNLARFINHCCQPNCTARIISRNGVKRIFIFSKTYIEKGEELTYDYKFPLEDNKIRCHCGAKFCRNFLN